MQLACGHAFHPHAACCSVISPAGLEEEHIYLEQALMYVNRAAPASDGDVAGGGGVPPTFYFIFTFREPTGPDGSKRHTLRDWEYVTADGARRKPISGGKGKSAREMLQTGEVDREALAALAKRVVAHFTEPYTHLCRQRGGTILKATCQCTERGCTAVHAPFRQVLSEACPILPDSVSVFDFSARECLREACLVNPRVAGQLVLPIGDALQEPFWPEGLGINRGIHNALDACWAANKWAIATRDEERQAVLAERQYLYEHYTAPLSGKNRKDLQPDSAYRADPDSRYRLYEDRALIDYARRARADAKRLQADAARRQASPRRMR